MNLSKHNEKKSAQNKPSTTFELVEVDKEMEEMVDKRMGKLPRSKSQVCDVCKKFSFVRKVTALPS